MTVEIDSHSGFCGGVIRAIGKAEQFLESSPRLYSLGEMVHNEAELSRLGAKGLIPIDTGDLGDIPEGSTVLIRAHGEPPETYVKARNAGIGIIDCTCPVVLTIQKSIKDAYEDLGGDGTVVIFGKIGHPEVLGLVGQTQGRAVVVENPDQLRGKLAEGSIRGRVEVFSQTTMSPDGYRDICDCLMESMPEVRVHDTICKQVAYRHGELSGFAREHDVIVFVSGRQSSNGRVLFELCRSVNPRTYHITDKSGLEAVWFRGSDNVGVCGATSTPKWLLDEVAETIEDENFA